MDMVKQNHKVFAINYQFTTKKYSFKNALIQNTLNLL